MAPVAEPEKTGQRTQPATSTAAAATATETPLTAGPTAGSPGGSGASSPQAGVPAAAPEEQAEPDDPFVDVQLTQTRGQGDTLTTQVVPTNTPPDATSQITPADRNPAGQYCSNIVDPAIDARIAWQRQNLEAAEKQVNERTRELEAKTAEYQRWLDRRDAFAEKAKKTVVDIYTKMRPDAAALQLQAMDEETAAAVIVKLDARSASAVMNEMDPEKAARLSSIISAAGKGPNLRGRPAQPGTGNRS
jgi:flagellar motility protein MotE (MotC chaperone)